jgi:hypothetical protein
VLGAQICSIPNSTHQKRKERKEERKEKKKYQKGNDFLLNFITDLLYRYSYHDLRSFQLAGHQWLIPVILASGKVEIRKIPV